VSVLNASHPREKIATIPPVAVFEVMSPENTIRGMMQKLNDYQSMGIPQIWIIDPEDKVWQRFEDGRLVDRQHFSHPELGISFAMSEIGKLVR